MFVHNSGVIILFAIDRGYSRIIRLNRSKNCAHVSGVVYVSAFPTLHIYLGDKVEPCQHYSELQEQYFLPNGTNNFRQHRNDGSFNARNAELNDQFGALAEYGGAPLPLVNGFRLDAPDATKSSLQYSATTQSTRRKNLSD